MEFSGWSPIDIVPLTSELLPVGSDRDPLEIGVGTVVQAMKRAAGEPTGEIPGDHPGVALQAGFLWETVVEYMLAGMGLDEALSLAWKRYCVGGLRAGIVQQLQVRKDGIRCTPDAVDPAAKCVESYKATRRSLRKAQQDFEGEFWTWVVQEKAYAYALGVQKARWIVWWMAGDYSKGWGGGPKVMEATATFSPEELEQNWRGVLTVAQRIREGGMR